MNNEHCVACLDIGGTSVKSGVVRTDGTLSVLEKNSCLIHQTFYKGPINRATTEVGIVFSTVKMLVFSSTDYELDLSFLTCQDDPLF